MTTSYEEDGLSTRTERSIEIAPSTAIAAIKAEVEASILIALKFPRDDDTCFHKLMKACKRPSFAEEASYSFKRGAKKMQMPGGKWEWVDNIVSGPSVHLAREAARIWGNVRHGTRVIADDEDNRTIESFAWDLQTNTKITGEDSFAKLIWRKKGESGSWIKPDERELRELTNRRGAILKRNCILEVLPKDLIEDARKICEKTILKGVTDAPDEARKSIILGFQDLNITPEMLNDYIGQGRKLSELSPAELVELRKIYTSIRDGHTNWGDYMRTEPTAGAETGKIKVTDLKPGKEPEGGEKAADSTGDKGRKPRASRKTKESAPPPEVKQTPAAGGMATEGEVYTHAVSFVQPDPLVAVGDTSQGRVAVSPSLPGGPESPPVDAGAVPGFDAPSGKAPEKPADGLFE